MRYLFVAIILTLFSTSLHAEVFTWTDKQGTQHFTDSPANIPPSYRKKAVVIKGSGEPQATPAVKTTASPTNSVTPIAPVPQKVAPRPKTAVELLASSLLEKATSDRDKAYAAFSWIRTNIYYDNSTKWQRRYGRPGSDQSPEGVLTAKRAVCEGMANLFAALTKEMGMKSAVVYGTASGMHQEAHAWNAVMVDGRWGLVDVTRHSFLSSPEDFLAHHFPADPQWQLLDRPLTYQEWLKR